MTQRPSVHRRIAASILGVDRSGRRPTTAEQQRRLPVRHRLLASLLGIRVRPSAPDVPSTVVAEERPEPAPPPTPVTAQVPPRTLPHRTARVDYSEHTPEPVPRPSPAPRRATWHTAPGGLGSVPQHLLSEDRPEFERVLDEALRSAPHRPELAAVGQRLNPEQLRTMALNATALITAAAATEYQHYVKAREELRQPAPRTFDLESRRPASRRLAATMGEVETSNAGVGAVLAVLTPVLAGAASALFLLVGYLLKMVNPEPAFARNVITTGWVMGAVTGVSLLVGAVGLLLTALRNRPAFEAEPYGKLSEEAARAEEAWREALLERGILPFLREALADPGSAARHRTGPPAPTSRMPHLGYDRPGFRNPDDTAPGPRPSFTSPDYTSPDFGGPEHREE
jgi:hypothetical protein